MTTPTVLKSLRPDSWPDCIHAKKTVLRFPNGAESGSWYSRANDGKTTEYVRRDPAVLAALPEVQALVADALKEKP
jgi:hypothetical protein